MRLSSPVFLAAAASALVPKWEPTWNLSQSTIVQPCNSSGFYDPVFLSQFAIVDFDWSNAKALWANAHPMNCEELLVEQAAMLKAVNPSTRVFVYRNLVKALPWYTSVREKITDPAYANWFLKFKPGGSLPNGAYHVPACDNNYDPPLCSEFYHDQDQTPQHPHGDGSCLDAPCDCGGVPCGEYLWDHAGGGAQLREWLVNTFVLGPTGLGNENISGVYLDDGWANTSQPIAPWMPKEGFCDHSPIGGATEEDYFCSEDMGLTQADTTAITDAWRAMDNEVQAAIVEADGFAWASFYQTKGAPQNASQCVQYFRSACSVRSQTYTSALMLEVGWDKDSGNLTQHTQDLASFLLTRGPYAWLGYGWLGCTSDHIPGAGGKGAYAFPSEWRLDYGTPVNATGTCYETVPGVSGVFERPWTNADVSFDCNTWTATVDVKRR